MCTDMYVDRCLGIESGKRTDMCTGLMQLGTAAGVVPASVDKSADLCWDSYGLYSYGIVMAHIVMAYIVMAYIVMAYILWLLQLWPI